MGSADTARDPRGFAIKFYTEEGNWDLVGNNTPIFFIRDPILVSFDFSHRIHETTFETLYRLLLKHLSFGFCSMGCIF